MSFEYLLDITWRQVGESPFELLAFGWFLFCWFGYNLIIDNFLRSSRGLSSRMHLYRVQWMTSALSRDNRVLDGNILRNLQSSMSFFASTSILILAGLLALLGASNQALIIIKQIPFAVIPPKIVWYLKIFLLIFLFIYSFFKMTWSLRQLNYMCILVGAMPPHDKETSDEFIPTARRAAMIGTMAAKEMNRGLRAYYFAIAVLSWFVSPMLFIVSTGLVVYVLYRREFRSEIVTILSTHTPGTDS